ncbi:hypothetical protein IVB16_08170 [Bradyrhizobium sp. 183]|uniref:hypothetical protein n=1 Tax=unclassified Bradyrhizobium TaxID=2631580 RepID=UPI001FFF0448|nr:MULTISPECIES: hypothetical protein [unclassified Bradyrhizobium]UPJ81927.1 hypothetical protein IVB17_08170 [Bradyrhizobium sp. 184]UPJ89721.1 hypothetical protein IVB16_08170 [Bradyrhizobium sp. 183]
MTEIRIDAAKAERMAAQILRDENKMAPGVAIAAAVSICRQMISASTTPLRTDLRAIPRDPPPAFNHMLAKLVAEAKDRPWNGDEVWELVYKLGREV